MKKRGPKRLVKFHKHLKEEGHSRSKYVGEFVYGAIDGTITTFAVVSAVVGAGLSPAIIIILGLANLFADGFSMAIGSYSSIKSQKEVYRKEEAREYQEVLTVPEIEKEEIRQIYKKKGFSGTLLKKIVKVITSNKKRWVDIMMKEELGLSEEYKQPLKAGSITLVSFILIGFIPLFAFVFSPASQTISSNAFKITIVLTAIALFIIGALKTKVTSTTWWGSGFEILFVGGVAAIIAYLIGLFLRGLVG